MTLQSESSGRLSVACCSEAFVGEAFAVVVGDVAPRRFDHHVVTHPGKHHSLGVVSDRRGSHLVVGDHEVAFGAENQQMVW